MLGTNKIEGQMQLLARARIKHDRAKNLVKVLKARVGPTSRELSDAKNERRKAHVEVTRLETLLKE